MLTRVAQTQLPKLEYLLSRTLPSYLESGGLVGQEPTWPSRFSFHKDDIKNDHVRNESSHKVWTRFSHARGFSEWLDTKSSSQDEISCRIALLSKILTYPLTMGMGLKRFIDEKSKVMIVHVVGGRAEATLPLKFWKELGYLDPNIKWKLVFVGPEVPLHHRGEAVPLVAKKKGIKNASEQLQQKEDGVSCAFISSMYEKADLTQYPPNAICLLNPGIASMKEWEPALQRILDARLPVLCTAYNRLDYEADLECAHRRWNNKKSFKVIEKGGNPFGSTWEEPHKDVNGFMYRNAWWWEWLPQ